MLFVCTYVNLYLRTASLELVSSSLVDDGLLVCDLGLLLAVLLLGHALLLVLVRALGDAGALLPGELGLHAVSTDAEILQEKEKWWKDV